MNRCPICGHWGCGGHIWKYVAGRPVTPEELSQADNKPKEDE